MIHTHWVAEYYKLKLCIKKANQPQEVRNTFFHLGAPQNIWGGGLQKTKPVLDFQGHIKKDDMTFDKIRENYVDVNIEYICVYDNTRPTNKICLLWHFDPRLIWSLLPPATKLLFFAKRCSVMPLKCLCFYFVDTQSLLRANKFVSDFDVIATTTPDLKPELIYKEYSYIGESHSEEYGNILVTCLGSEWATVSCKCIFWHCVILFG